MTNITISDMPPELIQLIVSHLPTTDLCCGVMAASRYLHACIPLSLVEQHKKYHRTSILNLALEGDLSGLQFVFRVRPNIPLDKENVIEFACGNGHLAAVKFLCQRGFDFNVHEAMYLAFYKGTVSIPLVKYVLHLPDKEYFLEDKTFYAEMALLFGYADILQFLQEEQTH